MGTITLSGNKDGQEPLSFSVSVADDDLDRLLYAQNCLLLPNGVIESEAVTEIPAVVDGKGNVVSEAVPAVPAVIRPGNTQETFEAICRRIVSEVISSTQAFYAARAAEKAAMDVKPIEAQKIEGK